MSKWELARKPYEHQKEVIFQDDIINKIYPGIQKLTKVVASTLGPNGKNVIIKLNMGNVYTKDGVTVARHTDFNCPYESLGADLIRESAKDTCDKVGDGTTCSTILANALIEYGLKKVKEGKRIDELASEINNDVEKIIDNLNKQSKELKTKEDVINVATISSNAKELGELIGGIYNKIGKDGVIVTEDSGTLETFEEEVDGIRFDQGLISPYFINNYTKQRSDLDDVYIFISDLEISSFAPFVEPIQKLRLANGSNPFSILIIADKVTGEALNGFLENHLRGYIRVACVEAPYSKTKRKEFLEDLALITGGKYISRDLNIKISDMDFSRELGKASSVLAGSKHTTVVGGNGDQEEIEKRIESLENERENSSDKKELDLRISRLKNKISILKVGGDTKSEIREKKYRIEDAVESTKVAMQGGIIVGGEMGLLNASREINEGIVKNACQEPFKQLISNIDKDYKDIINKVNGDIGFNAKTEKIENLIDVGIIDPVLVPITALRNAASVAINFLKTGGVVFNIRDLDEPTDKPLHIE